MQLGMEFWLLAVLGVLITGISKSGFAGGMGVITVPLLALQIGPIRAAAIMLPLLLVMDVLSVSAWLGQQRNDLLRLLLPAAFAGITVGYFLFDYLDEQKLSIMLGVLSIAFAVWGLFKGHGFKTEPKPWLGRTSGVVAGLTSFLTHAGGPPLNFYLLPLQLPRPQFLATAVLFFAAINLVKLVPYTMLGQINGANLLIGLILAPVAWLGVWLGLKIQHKINDKLFNRIILLMLLVVGSKLIIDSYV